MLKNYKGIFVRISMESHRLAKLQACKEGITLQDWFNDTIEKQLKTRKSTCVKLCQECGKWELKQTGIAVIGKCEDCGKNEIAVLPCWEKK